MTTSEEYKNRVFAWLESIMKCELLGATELVTEPDGVPLRRPNRVLETNDPHPGAVPSPSCKGLTFDEFYVEYEEFVNALVKEFNWHEHTGTCWKYLKRGEAHDDKHCRLRIDGSTSAVTTLDGETLSILLRRLHPRIACYNDLVIFLLKCNVDLKHVGSGEAAKALVYYVTDYITKQSIPAHVGLAALASGIQKTNTKVTIDDGARHEPRATKTGLITAVNSVLSRMEMSQSQVLSYLVGGGDHYKSHAFDLLYLRSFVRFVSSFGNEIVDGSTEALVNNEAEDGFQVIGESDRTLDNDVPSGSNRDESFMTLTISPGSISASNQLYDYVYRSSERPFDGMCLYEYVGWTRKAL
ncbi:hypothetical protein BJ138DRAFT_976344, partial [Hygrophoropsis aurantiaca]